MHGVPSVRAYEWVRQKGTRIWWYEWIWRAHLNPKISAIVWRLLPNSLATDDNFMKRRVWLASECSFSKRGGETVVHILWACSVVRTWCLWLHNFFDVRLPSLEFKNLCTRVYSGAVMSVLHERVR